MTDHLHPVRDFYLLTWNCKHIANAQIQKKLLNICADFGYKLPLICTPYELMGE
ncbi:hypothetical protein C789_1880 [Microcystis aeruginosa FACHB-905 = DIANCHI905]|nr:hypothetical protein C789_1880 [Microcystis aeruginosa FACHB-905 = DIANCHI905]